MADRRVRFSAAISSYTKEQNMSTGVEDLPFLSSTRAAGDISRLALLDDSDLGFGGLFCRGRDDSVGVLELEPDLEAECVLCNVRGSSVGVSE